MKKTAVILSLLIIAGCKTPAPETFQSGFDSAIENLSAVTEQMEELRREKDFFIKVLEDFEGQKAEHNNLLNSQQLRDQMRNFASWHRDIAQREKDLAILHNICVYAAHNQVIKRRYADPNTITLASQASRKPD